jgi:hypothetical protein
MPVVLPKEARRGREKTIFGKIFTLGRLFQKSPSLVLEKVFWMIESWHNLTIVTEWLSDFSGKIEGLSLSDFIRLISC